MNDLPALGVGIVYSPGLEPVLEAGRDIIDVIEIEPQTFWFKGQPPNPSYRLDPDAFARFTRFPQAKIVHGVGFAIGGTVPPDAAQLPPFIESIETLGAPWASEHLSFNKVAGPRGPHTTGFLLPPLQTRQTVDLAAANIRKLQRELPVPFAFETGVNYLSRHDGEMSDGAFFAAVAEAADCGILLDLHNLWANERNGRQTMLDALAEMPLERVWEVHLAGGDRLRDHWLDAHSGLVPRPLMELTGEILPRLPNLKAVIFEIIEDYLPIKSLSTDDLLAQMADIRSLWDQRHESLTAPRTDRHGPTRHPAATENQISPVDWEQAVSRLAIGWPPDTPVAKRLSTDPGIPVYQELVTSVRGGMVVSLLTLTYRLLVLNLGEERVMELLKAFWNTQRPEQFASAEVRGFADFLCAQSLDIPHLNDVLSFEIASQDAILKDAAQTVRFQCDPMPLLDALREGHLPPPPQRGDYEITINP